MNKLIKDIDTLAKIGVELCGFARGYKGRNWQYTNDNISMYNAETSSHKAFSIDEFSIDYFSTYTLTCTPKQLEYVPKYIERARRELRRLEEEFNSIAEREKEEARRNKIESLKTELKELGEDIE